MAAEQPVELGRRIVVWGATGSGKTTLARHLGEVFGLGVVEIDAIRHASGWDTTPWSECEAILTQRLDACRDGWVSDGSYYPLMPIYLPRADTLVWLHLPWRVSFWRLFLRTLRRAIDQQPLYNEDGPRESWRQTFLSQRSILWWSISHHRAGERLIRTRIATLEPHVRVYELRSQRQVDALITRVVRGQVKA